MTCLQLSHFPQRERQTCSRLVRNLAQSDGVVLRGSQDLLNRGLKAPELLIFARSSCLCELDVGLFIRNYRWLGYIYIQCLNGTLHLYTGVYG